MVPKMLMVMRFLRFPSSDDQEAGPLKEEKRKKKTPEDDPRDANDDKVLFVPLV